MRRDPRTHPSSFPGVLAILLIATSLAAQAVTATPRGLGLETQEGGDQLASGWTQGRATVFGGYAEARFQYHDGELDDGQVRVLRWLGFRHDDHDYFSGSGTGRTWQDVQLRLGINMWAALGTDYAANLQSPSLVFSGSLTWPEMSGRPATRPAAQHPGLRLPFSKPFVHLGYDTLVEDFQFRAGKLRSGSWPSNKAYQLDGVMVVTNMTTPAVHYPALDTGCHDQGHGGSLGAFVEAVYQQYSKLHSHSPGTIQLRFRNRETAVGQQVVQAVGVAGLPAGIDVGARCNRLYLDLSQPHLFFPAVGAVGRFHTASAPRTPANLGVELWLQAAWKDSVDGRFSLTRAARCAAPALGMTDLAPRKQMLISTGPGAAAATSGELTAPGHHMHHPISFYGH